MFAVPGWSVSSSHLKTQILESSSKKEQEVATLIKSTRKRKRERSTADYSRANSTDFLGLWDKVVKRDCPNESLAPRTKCRRRKLCEKHPKEALTTSINGIHQEHESVLAAEHQTICQPTRYDKEPAVMEPTARKPIQVIQNIRGNAHLTPLQISMRQKLVSARFRHINETLYTTPSFNSFELFRRNPEMFQDYHEGFRQQARIWPENPVNGYIAQIQLRGMHHGHAHGYGNAILRNEGNEHTGKVLPLPRSDGVCHIADLGCGDALLSLALDNVKKRLRLQVFSFDLQGFNPFITECDIADLPLENGSIDVAIFCLALMGTNWIDFIEEAYRILRWRGELWVTEIRSRFGKVSAKSKVVEHSVGKRIRSHKAEIKKINEDIDTADLLTQVDGCNESKVETDVSAFVEVLSKRGFILQNEGVVDLNNKMFVTLKFIKGQTPAEGKCNTLPRAAAAIGQPTQKMMTKTRFQDDKASSLGESDVLRPCVYKIR